jgi:hypothetical protein
MEGKTFTNCAHSESASALHARIEASLFLAESEGCRAET